MRSMRLLTLAILGTAVASCYEAAPTATENPCQSDCALDRGLHVVGMVWVGARHPLSGEAEVLFFTPSDSVSPRLVVGVYEGGQYEYFWTSPSVTEACSYLVRARHRSGSTTELKPLLSSSAQCRVSWRWDVVGGATLSLP